MQSSGKGSLPDRQCCLPLPPPPHAPRSPTWAALRTAILRTVAGALAPKEAGMDFWTLPKVSAPYLRDRACDCCPCPQKQESSMLLAPIGTLGRWSPGPWSTSSALWPRTDPPSPPSHLCSRKRSEV